MGLLLPVVLGALSLWAIGSCSRPYPFPDEILIGVIPYTRGDRAEVSGEYMERGARMAAEEINSRGGVLLGDHRVPLRLRVEGISDNPEEAVAAVQRLINHGGVSAILGPAYSSEAIPAGTVAEASRVPLLAPIATHPSVTRKREFVFRLTYSDKQQGKALALFAHRELGAGSAGILFDQTNPYSLNLAEVFRSVFEEAGGRVVSWESFPPGSRDYSVPLARIRAARPDLLFLPNYTLESGLQVRQARDMGIRCRFLGGDGWDSRGMAAIPQAEGAYMAGHWSRRMAAPASQAFSASFERIFGKPPMDTAALAYDGIGLIAEAIRRAGSSDPQAIRDALYALPPYPGITGSIDFTKDGDPLKNVVIKRIQGGQDIFYQSFLP